jgi:hypothetical protein
MKPGKKSPCKPNVVAAGVERGLSQARLDLTRRVECWFIELHSGCQKGTRWKTFYSLSLFRTPGMFGDRAKTNARVI